MKFRTVIVGSGVAGSIVARELLDGGESDIAIIEVGEKIPMRDRRVWLDYVMTEREVFNAHRPEKVDSVSTGKDEFLVRHSQLRAHGGATLIWHGIAMRMKPEDFQMRSRVGLGADWPFTYDELEPYYAAAETTLQVAGDAGDSGHPPRSTPFPLPALSFELDDGPFITAMRKRGSSVQRQCISRNSESIHGRSQCQSTGTCRYCPFGARFTGDQLLEDVEKRTGVRMLSPVAALRLVFSSATKATALEAQDAASGKSVRIEAERFIVCGGGVESPKLLLNSRSPWWPQGVGNHSGHLGRLFFSHPLIVLIGSRQSNPNRVTKELGYPTVTSRYYDDAGFQRDGKFTIQCWGQGHDLGAKMISGSSRSQVEAAIKEQNRTSLAILVDEVPEWRNRVDLAPGADRYGLPRTEIHYTWGPRIHAQLTRIKDTATGILTEMGCKLERTIERPAAHPMGTCRMSRAEGSGVVDANLRVHGTDNVYVCSSAVFPTGGAVNPTLTIAALAHRLGQQLIQAGKAS